VRNTIIRSYTTAKQYWTVKARPAAIKETEKWKEKQHTKTARKTEK
jgi:hypothetical protein